MHITLRQLQVFLVVHSQRNLSKAASRLCVSTSAVSQALKELEKALDAELFTRTPTGLVPTAAAASLVPHATLVIKKSEEIEEIFAAKKAGLAGHLLIGANRASGIYILSRRLPLFKQHYPAVEPSLVIDDNELIEEGVLENKFDVGFISRPPLEPTLTYFACFRDDFVIVASPKSPYIAINTTTEDFSLATWVVDEEEVVRNATLRWLQGQGITASAMITMNMFGAIKRAVMTGCGLAVLPYLSVKEEILRGDLVELRKDVRPTQGNRLIYVIFKDEHNPSLRELFFKECGIEPLHD